jgi:hypothetical protein
MGSPGPGAGREEGQVTHAAKQRGFDNQFIKAVGGENPVDTKKSNEQFGRHGAAGYSGVPFQMIRMA